MNKAEALQVYIEGFLKQKSEQYFKEIIEYHMENYTEIVEEFCQSFKNLCQNIRNDSEELPSIYYIQISMLLNRLLQGQPSYLLEAFGSDYFLEAPVAEGIYDPQWLTGRLLMFFDEMKQEAKRYMMAISEIEVEKLFITEVKPYEKLITLVAIDAMESILDSEEYAELRYEDAIEFRIGEFRGDTELLFVKSEETDRIWRDINEILLNQAG